MYTLQKSKKDGEWIITDEYTPKGLISKVIASHKFRHESIPTFDLPEEIEVDVEKLARNEAYVYRDEIDAFKYGYNKRAETHPYSEKDLIKALELARKKDYNFLTMEDRELSQSKIIELVNAPKVYEVEISEPVDGKVQILKFKEI